MVSLEESAVEIETKGNFEIAYCKTKTNSVINIQPITKDKDN